MLSRSGRLLLPRPFFQAMLEHAQTEFPNECCGILAGQRDGELLRVLARYPLVNELASKIRYHSTPFQAQKACTAAGHEFVAIYHSHPTSAPIPSETDLKENGYGTFVVHFIIGLKDPEPVVRGWWLLEDSFEEAAWEIVEL